MPIKVTYQNPGLEYDENMHGMRRFSEYGNVASRILVENGSSMIFQTCTELYHMSRDVVSCELFFMLSMWV